MAITYEYIIKSVVNKRTDIHMNPYHKTISGSRCHISEAVVGHRGVFLVEIFNLENDEFLRWYYTSLIESVTEADSGEVVIETMNSIYELVRIGCDKID